MRTRADALAISPTNQPNPECFGTDYVCRHENQPLRPTLTRFSMTRFTFFKACLREKKPGQTGTFLMLKNIAVAKVG